MPISSAVTARFDAAPAAVPGSGARTAEQPAAEESSAFTNIALAHQELYTLYEIAQTMGTSLNVADTMALISAKLAAVVPWTGCALFLKDHDSDNLLGRNGA